MRVENASKHRSGWRGTFDLLEFLEQLLSDKQLRKLVKAKIGQITTLADLYPFCAIPPFAIVNVIITTKTV